MINSNTNRHTNANTNTTTTNTTTRIKFAGVDGTYDWDTYDYDDTSIVWMAAPSPSILKSLVDPPTSISDAVGYRVEVKSHLPHAEEGDYFQGNIVIAIIIIIIIIIMMTSS